MDPTNPYDAPQSSLEALDADAEGFLREARQVPAGNATDWLARGWDAFLRDPGVWIGVIVLWFIVILVLSCLPVVGGIATQLLMPVFTAGFALGCDAQRRGEPLAIGHMFEGFQRNVGQLLLVGVINLAISTAVVLVAFAILFGGAGLMGGIEQLESNPELLGPGVMIGIFAVIVIVTLPLTMAMLFSPALVVLNDVPALEAMLLSLRACLRNLGALIVWALLSMLVMILGALPLFLGWLVTFPMMFAMTYWAYRDLFYAR